MQVKINIDVQDGTTLEEIEKIIDNALNENGVDCCFEVEKED